jgi:hypothetical protein
MEVMMTVNQVNEPYRTSLADCPHINEVLNRLDKDDVPLVLDVMDIDLAFARSHDEKIAIILSWGVQQGWNEDHIFSLTIGDRSEYSYSGSCILAIGNHFGWNKELEDLVVNESEVLPYMGLTMSCGSYTELSWAERALLEHWYVLSEAVDLKFDDPPDVLQLAEWCRDRFHSVQNMLEALRFMAFKEEGRLLYSWPEKLKDRERTPIIDLIFHPIDNSRVFAICNAIDAGDAEEFSSWDTSEQPEWKNELIEHDPPDFNKIIPHIDEFEDMSIDMIFENARMGDYR